MRKLLSVFSLVGVFALFAPACSSGTSSSSSGAADDTCAFLADPNNCYRRLVAAVDACLTDGGGDAGSTNATGTLSADGLSCTYASGRTVKFVGDVRQYGAGKTTQDVTAAIGGKTCVHYVSEPQSSITITDPDGRTLSVVVAGAGETITCPDGSQHGIDVQKLFGGCGDGGNILGGSLPGTTTSGSGTIFSGSLIGTKKQIYSCKTP